MGGDGKANKILVSLRKRLNADNDGGTDCRMVINAAYISLCKMERVTKIAISFSSSSEPSIYINEETERSWFSKKSPWTT